MPSIRQVIQYSGMNYNEVLELPLDVFLLMRKHYIIDKLMETEEGQQYLKDCERLTQKDIDITNLKRVFGGNT